MPFAHNTPPANNNQRPTPIDRRFDDVDAMIEAAVRRVVGNSTAAPATTPAVATGVDPLRDMVKNALDVAGISTEGKSDSQMLADYTDMLRKTAQAAKATASNSQAAGDFAGYDLNQPTVNAAAAPVAGNSGQKAPGDDFAGYDMSALISGN